MKKKILIGILILLVLVQFIRPKRNIGTSLGANDISHVVTVPDSIMSILKASCFDCHSNNTVYPWYAEVNPVGWWLTNHVNDGKRALNFSEFASYPAKKMDKKLDGTAKEVKEHDMPLSSYTLIHTYAKLSDEQISAIVKWTEIARAEIKSKRQ